MHTYAPAFAIPHLHAIAVESLVSSNRRVGDGSEEEAVFPSSPVGHAPHRVS